MKPCRKALEPRDHVVEIVEGLEHLKPAGQKILTKGPIPAKLALV